MSISNDVILGALKLIGSPDVKCFTSWKEFLLAWPTMFGVEINRASITNVTIGMDQPGADETDHLWVRFNNAGVFVGLYAYSQTGWFMFAPSPNAIIRMYGDSTIIPKGFRLADTSNPRLTNAAATALMTQWHSISPGVYDIFDVTWEGLQLV